MKNKKNSSQKVVLFILIIFAFPLIIIFQNCSSGGGGGGGGGVTTTTATGVTAVSNISAGNSHSCARLGSGMVKCWGDNSAGQLGDGTTTTALSAVSVSAITTSTFISSAGWLHSCALISGGTASCWGFNLSGQLGNGATSQSLTPVNVSGISTATSIATGNRHTCFLLSDGTVKCAGRNLEGQLGMDQIQIDPRQYMSAEFQLLLRSPQEVQTAVPYWPVGQ